jgi:hypothetical protein
MMPVTITGGDRESREGGYWRVPKRDLIVVLQVLLQGGELKIASGLRYGDHDAAENRGNRHQQEPSRASPHRQFQYSNGRGTTYLGRRRAKARRRPKRADPTGPGFTSMVGRVNLVV